MSAILLACARTGLAPTDPNPWITIGGALLLLLCLLGLAVIIVVVAATLRKK